MTTKDEVLQAVQMLVGRGLITKGELDLAYEAGSGTQKSGFPNKEPGIAKVLSCIGGVIVFIGIVVLLAENWSTLGFGAKVLATFGAGVAAYVGGILLGRDQRTEAVGSALCAMSGLVLPLGLGVIVDHAGFDLGSFGVQSLFSGALFALYLLSYLVWRRNTRALGQVFLFFSVCFGTWLFFSLTSLMAVGWHFDETKFFEYRVLAVGMGYMLLGRAFATNEQVQLREVLSAFGILGFLGAALVLGGWKPAQKVFWELIYPVLVFGTLWLSVKWKSKSFLNVGTIFLMAYIIKVTSEYFSSSLGWPLTLIIAGLALMGAGYLSLGLKRNYWAA